MASSPRDLFKQTVDRDFALVVEGQKIFINRNVLANLSPVFKKMFFGELKEALPEVTEVPFPQKKLDEMEELMKVIFWWPPHNKPISKENVDVIVKLADEYELESLLQDSIHFIKKQMGKAHGGHCSRILRWARLCFQYPHCLAGAWPSIYAKINRGNLSRLLELADENGMDGAELKEKCVEWVDGAIAKSTTADGLLRLLVLCNECQLQEQMETLVPQVAEKAKVEQIQYFYDELDAGVVAAVMEAKAIGAEKLLDQEVDSNPEYEMEQRNAGFYYRSICETCFSHDGECCITIQSIGDCSDFSKSLLQK